MRKLLSIALCLPLAACVIGEDTPGGGSDDQQGSNTGSNNGSNDGSITGLISQDTTWSGTVLIGYANNVTTRIDSGVTVTVSPGTIIQFKPGASLDIKGTLRAQGTAAQKIQIGPASDNAFGLILGAAPTAGKLELTYVEMSRGNIQTNAGSTATIVDTQMYKAAGDLLIMNGGTITMSYSQIGPKTGQTDTTHCNIHTSGDANTISITHSNLNGSPYGLMLYGGQNAIFTNNNWYDNTTDVDTQPGVSADISGSWFDGAKPVAGSGATLTENNLSNARLTDAGVRP
jgi:hypothetical protein